MWAAKPGPNDVKPRQSRRKALILTTLFIVVGLFIWFGNDLLRELESSEPSRSTGTRTQGKVHAAKRLPTSGANFQTYSRLWSTLGRTCVHERVRRTMLDSYGALHADSPAVMFTYGETGWCSGGDFWPHRTHQNGLSVDFMVPVRRDGRPVPTPTSILNGWGYGSTFDEQGRMGDYEIDFDAAASHLEALQRAAKSHGLRIERVILEPTLHDELFATTRGGRLKRRLHFMKRRAWIAHDDHYHVDFAVDPR